MSLRHIIRRYADASYKLGGQSPEEGMDCLSLLLNFADEKGKKLPDSFEGITRENYASLWEKDREKARRMLIRFAQSLGNEIPVGKAFAGDILIVRQKSSGQLSIGIHAGGNLILTAFEEDGIQLANLDGFEIRRAYRWA